MKEARVRRGRPLSTALLAAAALAVALLAVAQPLPQVEGGTVVDPAQPGAAAVVQQVGGAHGRPGNVQPIPTDSLKPQALTTPDGMPGWSVTIPGGRALATPAVENGKVFVGGGFGSYEFYAFDAQTGKPVWAIKVSDDGPTAAVVQEACVAFNTESCTLFVCETNTGKMLWSRWLGDPLMSQPAIAKGRLFMAYPSPKGQVLACFDLKTGKEHWQAPIVADIISAPVCEGDSVYLSTHDGNVHRYRAADGAKVWVRQQNATSAPWIAQGQVYVTMREMGKDDEGREVRYEGLGTLTPGAGERQQKALWTRRQADYLSYEVQAGSAYGGAAAKDDASVGFGGTSGPAPTPLPELAPDGGQKQTFGYGGYAAANVGQANVRGIWEFQGSRAAVLGGRLYNTMGAVVQCVNPNGGKMRWEKKLAGDLSQIGGHLATPPSLAGGKLYLGTAAGQLICLNPKSGKVLWRHDVDQPIRFQPAIAEGRVYVGTTAGTLVCIDTGDATADGWLMWGGSAGHNGPASG